MPSRALSVVAIAAVVGVGLWYVVAPPRSVDGYRERASSTAEVLRSQVQTARIWLRTLARGDALRTSARVGLRESEEDASAAAEGFQRFDPPVGTDAVRAGLSELSSQTTARLADIRIAADRGQWARLPQLGGRLPALADRLRRFAQRAQP
jgi:hypothetical protein